MRALYDGVESNTTLALAKGGDDSINLMLITDDGLPIDITGDAVDVEVHPAKTRTGVETKLLGTTLGVVAAGQVTIDITDVVMDFGPGTYYCFARWTEAGGNINYADGYAIVVVN